jgi:hypothetical protein
MKRFVLFLALVLVAFGCNESPTEPDQVLVDGRCNQVGENTALGTATVICEDTTVQVGGDLKVDVVKWSVRSSAGNLLDSANTQHNGAVTFPAIPCAEEEIQVEQTVFIERGATHGPRIHSVPIVCTF